VDLGDGKLGEDFEDLTADASDSNNEDFGVEERGGVSIDESEHSVRNGECICEHGL
jgi:hypothetical protein